MSKKQPIDEQTVTDAATEALAEELLALQADLEHERSERKQLEAQVQALRESLKTVTQSVEVAPPPPAPLERPVVTLEDGTRLRFICGSFRANSQVHLATDVAADPEQLAAVLAKYPGLFEPA